MLYRFVSHYSIEEEYPSEDRVSLAVQNRQAGICLPVEIKNQLRCKIPSMVFLSSEISEDLVKYASATQDWKSDLSQV